MQDVSPHPWRQDFGEREIVLLVAYLGLPALHPIKAMNSALIPKVQHGSLRRKHFPLDHIGHNS